MFLIDIITNEVLIVPLVAMFIAQTIKNLIELIVNKRINLQRLFGDGGMPSSHTATVFSLALMVGLTSGWGSPLFGVAAILAGVVMHDATGVRRETGKQAVVIIDMVKDLQDYFSEKNATMKAEKLKVLVGHSRLQVFFGMVLAAVVVLAYWFLLRPSIIG